MKMILIILHLMLSLNVLKGQGRDGYYKIGDTLKVSLYQVQNYKDSILELPVKGKKLTLIEIWGIGCKACIQAMPQLQLLQDRFADDVQSVLLCVDNKDRIESGKRTTSNLREVRIPIVPGENLLHKKFHYRTYGFYIWLDQDGVIRYMSSKDYVTENNISNFILGKSISIPEVRPLFLDKSIPVKDNLEQFTAGNELIEFYIAKKNPTFSFQTGLFKEYDQNTGTLSRLYSYGINLENIFKIYLNRKGIHNSKIVYEGVDSIAIVPNYEGIRSGQIVFDLRIHISMSEQQAISYLARQLMDLYNLKVCLNIRKSECYILKKIKEVNMETKFTNSESRLDFDYNFINKNVRWDGMLASLNSNGAGGGQPPLFIVDESGNDPYKFIDITFLTRFDDLNLMNASLLKYGLIIEKGEREQEIILITSDI